MNDGPLCFSDNDGKWYKTNNYVMKVDKKMKVLVGISGGVDSAYAAYKLKAEGCDVAGACLIMHDGAELEAARRVCGALDIPLHEIDCRDAFYEKVQRYFVKEYMEGRTPNPCIVCNREVKLRALLDVAEALGYDKIATGHYARITTVNDGGQIRYAFSSAQDGGKDQTYMLYRVEQDVLSRLLLPLSDERKADVKARAESLGISQPGQRESQEICFITNGKYTDYVERIGGKSEKGSFISEDGEILGQHKGIINYTLGQRKGLGVSVGYKAFVTDINPHTNTVTLGRSAPLSKQVRVGDIVCSGMREPEDGHTRRVCVKLRYLAPTVAATVKFDGMGGALLELDVPHKSVTPGQSAVFYDGDTVIAGGIIRRE